MKLSLRPLSLAKLLTFSSGSLAELFSRFVSDEKKRRGVYQAEWAGKLPWEIPGLDEAALSVEIDLRGAPGPPNQEDNREQQELGMEDLTGDFL